MIVRPAVMADADPVHAIYAPLVRDTVISFELSPPSSNEMAARIERGAASHPWLVAATSEREILGYAYASTHRERAAYQWSAEVSVYVAPHAHRRGVASRLYVALLRLLMELGYRRALAGIALPNPASVAFHEALGFLALGTYHRVGHKHGAWHDVGWWERGLEVDGRDPRESPSASPDRVDARQGSREWDAILEEIRS